METVHEPKDLETTGAGRGVWLVKVPKYLSETWKKGEGRPEVGKLRITKPKIAGGKPEVVFTLDDTLFQLQKRPGETPVPKDHKFVLTGIANQNLSILTETNHEKVSVEGKVIQRAECRPMADKNYMNLKRKQIEETNKPQREVIQLDKIHNAYKPVNNHRFNIEHDLKKKEEGKRARSDKDVVMEMLFSAFEKHQYYNIKDLVTITKQPVPHLVGIIWY
ncbi:general transcription factor IIF subunit 2-like isoform X2 [Tubulanus polymorphus]|uniref:general transcription factor IIF subunit 2-like isoform X2 n=1 Tax=Tubulanus polymorphus TaxID=672921 RepID=UPI003DA24C62